MPNGPSIEGILEASGPVTVAGLPEGFDALVLGRMALALKAQDPARPAALMHIARDDRRMAALEAALEFFAPDIEVVSVPAWDCVPYDRISPKAAIESRRIASLTRLAFWRHQAPAKPVVVLTSVNGAVQRVPGAAFFENSLLRLTAGDSISMDQVVSRLEQSGYFRSGNVNTPFAAESSICFPLASHSRFASTSSAIH
jgi:transcription-repair coupling factor (superfamily II helicase)